MVVKIGDAFTQVNHHLIAEFGVVQVDLVEKPPDFDVCRCRRIKLDRAENRARQMQVKEIFDAADLRDQNIL